MTTAYTSLLGLALPVTGELSGTWGDTVNNSITSLLDSAVAGTTNVSTDADVTLTTTTGAANTAREAILLFSGARTALRTITAPAQSKVYTVINATTGGYSVKLVGAGPTTGLTIPNGASAIVAWNGSDFVEVGAGSIGNLTVNGTLTVTGATTLQSTLAVTGNITNTAGTANGVTYLNGSKVLTSGSALTFDGTNVSNTGRFIVNNAGSAAGTTDISFGSLSGGAWINTPSGTAGYLAVAGTGAYFWQSTSHTWNISGTENMRLTSTGLGIGTSSPLSKLDARAANATMGNYQTIQAFTTDTATVDYGGGISLGGNYSGTGSLAQFASIAGRKENGTAGNYAGYLQFGTNSQATGVREVMRLDSSGNLGLGVTPSAQSSLIKAFDFNTTGGIGSYSNSTSTQFTFVTSNAYLNSGVNWTYKFTGYAASAYMQNNGTGVHQWLVAPSGTAGNAITFTQAMTLDASGNLGVGTTSPAYKLQVADTVAQVAAFTSSATATAVRIDNTNAANWGGNLAFYSNGTGAGFVGTIGSLIGSTAQDITMWATSGNGVRFYTNGNNERARIDSSGNMGIGTSSPTVKLDVNGTIRARDGAFIASIGTATKGLFCTYNQIFGSGTDYTPVIFAETGLGITFAINGSATKAMTLDASGRLGIGLTPTNKFQVAVDGTYTANISSNSGNGARIVGTDYANTAYQPMYVDGSFVGIQTGGAERARLNSSGNFILNGTSAYSSSIFTSYTYGASGIANVQGIGGGYCFTSNAANNGGVYYHFTFEESGAQRGSITSNGTITVYNTTSDYRLKTVVGAVTGHGARIDALEPIEYTWNSSGKQTRGFLAHKFQEVYEDSVTGAKDAVDANGKPIYQQMQAGTAEVIADLVAEIQSLRKRLAALEAK